LASPEEADQRIRNASTSWISVPRARLDTSPEVDDEDPVEWCVPAELLNRFPRRLLTDEEI
jgi:hypothetical protein